MDEKIHFVLTYEKFHGLVGGRIIFIGLIPREFLVCLLGDIFKYNCWGHDKY